MMDDVTSIIFYLILIAAVIICRIVLSKVVNTSNSKWQLFGYSMVFVLYCIIVQILLFLTYNMLPTNSGSKECYFYMALCTCCVNVVTFFVGIVYYLLRRKRKISGIDKMKLKDM